MSLGQQQLTHGLYSFALETFEREIALDETNLAAWEGKAAALKNLGRWGEAVEVEERLVEVRGRGIVWDAEVLAQQWYDAGFQKIRQGDLLGAIEDLEKAIEFKPDYHETWSNRGAILLALGRHEEAIDSYEKAIEFKHDHYDAWYCRGNALSNLGRNYSALWIGETGTPVNN